MSAPGEGHGGRARRRRALLLREGFDPADAMTLTLDETRARLAGQPPATRRVFHRCPFCSTVLLPADTEDRACGQCRDDRKSTHDPISLRRLRRPKGTALRPPDSATRRRGVRYRARMI